MENQGIPLPIVLIIAFPEGEYFAPACFSRNEVASPCPQAIEMLKKHEITNFHPFPRFSKGLVAPNFRKPLASPVPPASQSHPPSTAEEGTQNFKFLKTLNFRGLYLLTRGTLSIRTYTSSSSSLSSTHGQKSSSLNAHARKFPCICRFVIFSKFFN